MSFFKKIFSSKKENVQEPSRLQGVASKEYFENRYTEQNLSENKSIVEGSLKMVESYLIDNDLEPKVKSPINHPLNLDQLMDDGMGFSLYCNAMQVEEQAMTLILAFAFSDFLINNFAFKLYKDSTPEYPLRGMTLKYSKDEIVFSLYPYEYAAKVLNYEANFNDLYTKINNQLKNIPSKEELLGKFMPPQHDEN